MAKRRLNGEGTIYSRPNGLWVSDVTIGYDSNGKRIRKTLSSMDIEKLKRKMNDLRVKNDMKVLNAPANSSVAEWFDFWLLTYKKPHVRPTTYDMYYNCVNNHIKPKLGKYKLDKLSNLIIQNFINKLSTENGLSTSTLKKILITLNQGYDEAIKSDILYKNPCANIKIPKKECRKATAFSVTEQSDFLNVCETDTTFNNMFVFGFNTGLRLGELMALTWKDYDETKNTISITKNMQTVKNYDSSDIKYDVIINSAKTQSGIREVPLNKAAKAAIINQLKRNNKNSLFIFYATNGEPLNKRNIYRAFKDRLKEAGITSPLTFHSIRHSFATRLLEKGADIKTVSELLGHKSIQITLDIYSHVSSGLKNNTVSLLDV